MKDRCTEEDRSKTDPRGRGRATAALIAAVLALPLMSLAGCFTYRAAEPPSPVLGEQVQVKLTGAGKDHLLTASGIDQDAVEGRLLGVADTSFTLAVTLDADQLGFGRQDYVDTMQIARRDVREVGVRAFSPTRTALMAAAFVGAGLGAWAGFSAVHSGTPPPNGGNQFFQLPLHHVLQIMERVGAALAGGGG